MPDVHMRLVHYKRIANAASQAELDELQVELIDRFGLLPPPLKVAVRDHLAQAARASSSGSRRSRRRAEGGSVRFAERAKVDPVRLIALIEGDPERYRLDGPYKLKFSWRVEAAEQRVGALEKLLKRLAPKNAESAAA